MLDRRAATSLHLQELVVGAMLAMPSRIPDTSAALVEDDFSDDGFRTLFLAMLEMTHRQMVVDPESLLAFLQDAGLLTDALLQQFSNLVVSVVSGANAVPFADRLHEHGRLRRLAMLGTTIAKMAAQSESADEVTSFAMDRLREIADDVPGSHGPVSLKACLGPAMDDIDRRHSAVAAGKTLDSVVSTGLSDLDRAIKLVPGRLMVLAGRPAMGKSVLALQMAAAAARSGTNALFISMEMPRTELVERLLSAESPVDYAWVQFGGERVSETMSSEEGWSRMTSARSRLESTPGTLFIDDKGCRSLDHLDVTVRRLHDKKRLGLIVVDYLQLMRLPGGETRNEGIGQVTGALKLLAMDLDVRIVVVSQLNRSLESRPNRRPVLSDLRDSGSIEQDADMVVFVYRDEVYETDCPDNKGWAELIVSKNRAGVMDTVFVRFQGQYCRFVLADGKPNLTNGKYSAGGSDAASLRSAIAPAYR